MASPSTFIESPLIQSPALPAAPVSVYVHEDPERTLYPLLAKGVPYTGSILRRIQSAIAQGSNGYILTTFSPSNIPSCRSATPWLVAYVDLLNGPDSQVWFYSSVEQNGTYPFSNTQRISFLRVSSEVKAIVRAQAFEIFAFITTRIFPSYAKEVRLSGSKITPVPKYNVPALHSGICEILYGDRQSCNLSENLLLAYRYLVPVNYSNCTLPRDYSYANAQGQEGIQPEHYELINSKALYKREPRHIRAMVYTVTIYYRGEEPRLKPDADGQPVAWLGVNVDGTLTSLYVDSRHRLQNLAIMLIGKAIMNTCTNNGIFKPIPGEAMDQRCVFGDVVAENRSSHITGAKLGAIGAWTSSYTTIEVDMQTRSLHLSCCPALRAALKKPQARL
ncbi:hypothetical protein KEM54_000376 [Ascosphaera aggregata]|nr:hypothetical protein KEM54_000376 [Ascosphaera aggregata]